MADKTPIVIKNLSMQSEKRNFEVFEFQINVLFLKNTVNTHSKGHCPFFHMFPLYGHAILPEKCRFWAFSLKRITTMSVIRFGYKGLHFVLGIYGFAY